MLSFFWPLKSSVADPERIDADPDPTFHADVDPDHSSWSGSEFIFFLIFSKNLKKIVMYNFLSNNAGGGVNGAG